MCVKRANMNYKIRGKKLPIIDDITFYLIWLYISIIDLDTISNHLFFFRQLNY